MTAIATSTFRRVPRQDMVGQSLPDDLRITADAISPGLVERIDRYAVRTLTAGGFDVSSWRCEIYTLDADAPASYRSYTAEYVNAAGGMIGVSGIEMKNGHPFLHHELSIDIGR